MRSAIPGKLRTIDRLLVQEYGTPRLARGDPLDELIATILSQNTNDTNSGRAYDAMRRAFPTWRDVLHADPRALERALKPGGLAKTKSRRIQKILALLDRHGDFSLDHLRRLPVEAAERELLQFDGVGLKTARCVLLFALRRDVFPIDTHIERILKRIGILPPRMTTQEAHALLPQFIPKGRCLALHINLIRHGRAICHARGPHCDACVLQGQCAYYRRRK